MKSCYIIFLFPFLFPFSSNGQGINMANSGTVTNPCSYTTFYDNNGTSNYVKNLNQVLTFCAPVGQYIYFNFTQFSLESKDTLKIFRGNSTSSPLIGAYTGTVIPGLAISNLGECLTFSFTSNASGQDIGWTANITCSTAVPTPPINDNPCNAISLPVNSSCSYSNYSNLNATASNGVPAPGCGSYSGGDVWFKAVVPATGTVVISTQAASLTDGAMAVYSGSNCSALSLITCNDDFNALMPAINLTGINPGDTLWIRFWEFGNDNNGTFGICANSPVPSVQDCPAAIPICQNIYNQTISFSGTGNIPTEINSANSCLGSGEKNDVWYTFTVQASGNLNFSLTPNNLSDDYDWAVYNLTNTNCAAIYTNSSLNISCNYSSTTGQTGTTTGSTLSNQTAGGTPFNAPIPVLIGQTYVINVSNFSATTSGYTLDLGSSTASIFDNIPPSIQSISPVNICGGSQINLGFSESILCSTIENSDFSISGPGGPYNLTAVSSISCTSGATTTNNIILSISPQLSSGTFQVCMQNTSIADLCGNVTPVGATSCKSFIVKSATTSTTVISTCVSYTWNGTTYSSSNSYTKMFTNAVGCDSTAVLSITIKQPTTSTTTINVCPAQLPYNWNGVIINATGSQTVHLTNAAGCDSSATLNLTVSSTSTSFNTASICSIQLPYVWNGQNLNISGDYSITLPNANSQGCDSIVRLHLIVNQSPLNPSTTLLITYCQFDLSSQLSASGNYPPMLWYNSPTGLNNTTNAPYPSTNLPGTYQYYVSQNNGNCESPRTNIKVVVNSKPELQKDTTLRICYGTTANLQILFNTTGLNFSWTTNNTPVYNPYNIAIGGIYQLIATNSASCIDTAVVNLIIQPKVIANAGNDDNASINTPYQLSGSGGGTYLWSPSFVLDNPTLANPTAILNSDTRFYLTVKDNWGCTDLDSVLIKVYNGQSFYVPNAFTPDGDGLNDLFRPTYVGIKKLDYFRVYNRYGVLIFETNDIGRGWDGRYKGVRQNLDNYIFIVKAIDKFGYDKVMKGNILLLR